MERLLAGAMLVAYGLHVAAKAETGAWAELLWMCNVATPLVAVGVLWDARRVSGPAWLFCMMLGLPLWLLDLLASGSPTTAPAVVLHLLAPVVGALQVRRRGWDRRHLPTAVLGCVVCMALARFATDPDLNVNMAHQVWPPVDRWFGSWWTYAAVNLGLFTLLLALGDAVMRAVFPETDA